MTNFERECRRARLMVAVQNFSDDIDKREYVENIMNSLEGFAGRTGHYATHKHPWDRCGELEEQWMFANSKRLRP